MHPIFQNPALVAEIFDSLNPYYFRTKQTSSLALTCKAFLSPALDCIWRRVDIFKHPVRLIKLIEGVQVDYCNDSISASDRVNSNVNHPVVLSIDRPLVASDIDLLRSYCRRVRCLHYNLAIPPSRYAYFSRVNQSLWAGILSIIKDEPLFPHPRELRVCTALYGRSDKEDFDAFALYLPAFWSPMLESFQCSGESNRGHWRILLSFLQRLQEASPTRLKSLDLSPLEGGSAPAAALQTISMFQSLERLSMRIPGHEAIEFQKLSCLDYLQTITLILDHSPGIAREKKSDRTPMAIPNVTTLEIIDNGTSNLAQAHEFFTFVLFPSLNHLSLTYDVQEFGPRDPQEWKRLFAILAEGSQRLQELALFCSDDDVVSEGTSLPWSTFSPLLDLRDLVDITIHEPSVESLSNQDFMDLATAWPNLTSLSLQVEKVGTGDADHGVLSMVLKHLPQLKSMSLPMCLTKIPSNILDHGLAPHMSLETLSLGRFVAPEDSVRLLPYPPTEDDDSQRLARILHALFPSLNEFVGYSSLDYLIDEEIEGVTLVQGFLRCLRERCV